MSIQYDPLSRTSVAVRRSIISLVVATVFTVALGYLLAPSRASDPRLWPAIVLASLRYTTAATTWLIEHPTWRAVSSLQIRPFLHGMTVSLGAVAMMVSGLLLWLTATNRKDYGDSEYAKTGDVRRLNLMGKLGPVLGKFGGRLLMPDAPRSTLVIAPTRAGKTRGIVIPTILTYKGSKVVIDPKRELIEKTADAERRAGRAVHVIDWTDPSSPSGWNPLGSVLN